MQYVRELECYQEQRKAAVTLGKFDGGQDRLWMKKW